MSSRSFATISCNGTILPPVKPPKFHTPLFKYGKREHCEQFMRDGTVRVSALLAFQDVERLGLTIGDAEEGMHFETLDQVAWTDALGHEEFIKEAGGDPTLFIQPHARNNRFIVRVTSRNFAIHCTSTVLGQRSCKAQSPDYDTAILIRRPVKFYSELTEKLRNLGVFTTVNLQDVRDVIYQGRNYKPNTLSGITSLLKEKRYQEQNEVRAIWEVGDIEPSAFYYVNVPDPGSYCEIIHFDNLGD